MNRQRNAGIVFVGIVVLILTAIFIVFGTSRWRGLRYTVVFSEGRGIAVGDRVQLNGVDIGEVDSVKLDSTGKKVFVGLKIHPEHRRKVLANSTASISDSTFLNVSGQKVIQIYNSSQGGGPMAQGATIQGKGPLELKAWQANEWLRQQSGELQKASRDLGEGAKQLTESARNAIESFTRGVKEGLKDGTEESPSPPKQPMTSPGGTPKKPLQPGELDETAKKLSDFLNELGSKGKESLTELSRKWEDLKADVTPLLRRLKDDGRELLHEKLQQILDQIEQALDKMKQERESRNGAEPTPDDGKPVPI